MSLQDPDFDFHFCGGVLISKDRVLTTAQCCLSSPGAIRVNAGEHSLSKNDGTEQVSDFTDKPEGDVLNFSKSELHVSFSVLTRAQK